MATMTEEKHTRDMSQSVLISCEVPPHTFSDDTVWIGFMDIGTVIGTVKEAVELVLALYEGNEVVMKEKEKALENIVKKSLKRDVNKSTVPDKPAASGAAFLTDKPATDADEYSGLINVREVSKEKIIEYVAKGSKRGPKPLTPAQQKEREKKVEKIKKDMLEKIRIIEPKFSQKEQLKEELKRSKRDEHVFNNDILKFHYKVLKDFIEKNHNLQGYNQQALNELGRHTLPQNTAEDIQTNMKAYFDEDEFYVNANAVLYGVYCSVLHEAMLVVLNHIKPDMSEEKKWVNSVIYHMNYYQIYVDHMAKVKWIASQRNRRQAETRFERVRGEVAHMYNTDRGVDWCIRILTEVGTFV